jgi:hypothetical protein
MMMLEIRREVAEEPWFYWIEDTDDPWRHWFAMLDFPCYGPLEAWIETDVEELCRAADERRLALKPQTERFAQMWATFRRHHENLEDCWKHRRQRWLTWRAAALTVICDRDRFQDVIDRNQARAKLAETMREHGPYEPDGSYRCGPYPDGSFSCTNFWRPEIADFSDGTSRPHPLTEYAAMVLMLVRATAEGRR